MPQPTSRMRTDCDCSACYTGDVNSQLENLEREFLDVSKRARDLAERAGAKFAIRPAPDRWSVAENLDHLRVSSELVLPRLEAALAEAKKQGLAATTPYRLDLVGKLLIWSLEPPSKFRVPAPPRFLPARDLDPSRVLADFLDSQERVLKIVRAADGLAVDRIKMQSPFAKYVRYSIWSALCAAASHQRRHLWQAERALQQV